MINEPVMPVPAVRGPCGAGTYFDSYTADQMLEYGAACAAHARELALSEAVKVCESEYDNWDNERPLRICATAIEQLKARK